MGYQLGVDLGTTYTAAAIIRNGVAEVATLGTRTLEIPSVVFLRDDGELLIGEAAERRSLTDPDRFAREVKRRIGDPTPVLLAGSPFSAHTLMAKLLRAVVKVVADREGAPPDHIVVTCPANWGDYKRELLDQAVRQADVGPVTVTTEPEAAAVHYASTTRVGPGETVAVYDLGGGTFDAAILRNGDAGFELVGDPQGIEQLGGVYFDDAVFSHVAGYVSEALAALDPDDPGSVAAVSRLRRDCVEAKEALSWDSDTTIPVALPNQRTEIRLTRGEFEDMARPALVESVEAMRRALRFAHVDPSELKAVLLVGGSSRIPLVGQMLVHELQRPIAIDVHPKHAVALGAAHIAAAQAAAPAAPATAGARFGAFGPTVTSPSSSSTRAVPAGLGAPPAPPRPVMPAPQTDVPPEAPPRHGPRHGRGPGPAGDDDDGGSRNRGLLVGLGIAAAVVVVAGVGWMLTQGGDDGGDAAEPAAGAPTTTTVPGSTTTEPARLVVDLPTGPAQGTETLAFTSRDGNVWNLALVNQDGSGFRQLTQERADKPRLPVWSPSRETLAYTLQVGEDASSSWELWVTDTNGDVKKQLATGLAADARATWSPDGTRLAYVSEQAGPPDIWVLDLTTGEPTQLTQTDTTETDPAWSPDGRSIAYSTQIEGNLDIYKLSVDDPAAAPVRLTEDAAADADPAWHPLDGSLAFARDFGSGNREIFTMNGEGANEQQLTDTPAAEEDPAWEPSGAYIAFESDRDKPAGDDDEYEIYVMLPDGTDVRRLTQHNGFDAHPAWGLTPEG